MDSGADASCAQAGVAARQQASITPPAHEACRPVQADADTHFDPAAVGLAPMH
jgi:hypothetical protein